MSEEILVFYTSKQLDRLEEMLQDEFSAEYNSGERISLIFSRFRKEQGLGERK